MTFDPPDIVTDSDTLVVDLLNRMRAALPGWEPIEGSVETALAEEFAVETAVVSQAALDSITLALAGIGQTVFGFPVEVGVAASLEVLVSVTAPGALIPSGFTVIGTTTAGIEVAFTLPDDVVAAGINQPVTLTATEVGTISNGVPIGPMVIATATAAVVSAAATAASVGGTDAETIDTYLSRLSDQLSVLRFGGVRAEDMAALARAVPGVARALAIDLYNPATPGVPTERTITVFPVDGDSQPVSAPIAAEVLAKLEAAREVNFIVHVGTPTYTPVAITYTAVAEAGASTVETETNIDEALTAYLATWGATPDDPTTWSPVATVRFLDVARVAGSAAGVAYVSTITINGGTADVVLPGVAPLPAPLTGGSPSTIAGTVT